MGSKRFTKQVSRTAIAVLAFGLGSLATPAWADFDDALRAYATQANGEIDPTKVSEALDLWHKYAVAGDILSRQILGDVYSNSILYAQSQEVSGALPLPEETGVIAEDRVKALAWYTIAATHNFDDFAQKPNFRQINARTWAQDRIPQLKEKMTTEQVARAESMVVDILSTQSEFDLFRLGVMFQGGNGLRKDNVEALKFYKLASNRARNANQGAVERAAYLLTIMTKDEIDAAERLARDWEPPLPDAFTAKSPRTIELENQNRVLRERQLALAIEEIEREFAKNNEHVIQSALASLGLYLGAIDGKMGAGTRQAIERFQYTLVEDDKNLTDAQKRDTMTGVLTPAQKVTLIERGAKVNHPQSQYIFGIMHAEGIGVAVDGEEAVKWLKKSASFGYPLAHYALGQYYRKGIYGDNPVTPSRAEASYHLGQAAALGLDVAQKDLTELYEFNFARD